QKEASSPVEEATPEHVHGQESARRSQDEVAQPDARAASRPLLGGERRVPVGAREEIRHVTVAPVNQRRRETPDAPRHRERFVDGALAEPSAPSAEEPEVPRSEERRGG